MSHADLDQTNAALLEMTEKVLKIANLQADTALKQAHTRFVPWQIWTAGLTSGAAVVGAAVALGHWL